ncbi:PucR family transcriptional regulator [Kitasatospora sp. DSM 101779]|uniref:PucR family transcriptional regulator n=1 Tax=Kitasatospora sp. DSM 101779 TaxID=2853165 RepID=UPI0021D9CE84|nr:PucR family transcriptional regulator [Kitasatospora sp. DSM 101779]MCU7821962.1 PucR family transcriptional regulator [Kitasatospora sp. DSM 101779]
MPALTVREVLALDVLGPAAPLLLAGRGGLERAVRRVRTAEVPEGGAALSGGELLLTDGHGLARATPQRQRACVRELAGCGAAALFAEVGRALPRMPAAVTAEAERLGLPLVALRRVVPFARVAEAVNSAIGSPPIGPVARGVRESPNSEPARALIGALLDEVDAGRAEATARAAAAGFRVPDGHRLLGLAARGLPQAPSARTPVPSRTAVPLLGRLPGTALAAAVRGGLFALLAVPPAPDPVRTVRAVLEETAPPGSVVALGPAVPSGAGWNRYGESLREAAATLELAVSVPPAEPRRSGPQRPYVATARAFALERELTRSGGRERWSRLAGDVLGPLLEWESRHAGDLVRTLEVHLRHGCSPTRTAALLHIGRQSLYQRLERIEGLLGFVVADPEVQAELLLATCAHRLLQAVPGTPAVVTRFTAAGTAAARPLRRPVPGGRTG